MTKAPDAFRTISEVAQALDVPQHVLRFWEVKFPQIKPLKRAGGRRYYRPGDIDLLRGVRALLYAEGYTIKGVQKVLREAGLRYVAEAGRLGPRRAGREALVTGDDAPEHAADPVAISPEPPDGIAAPDAPPAHQGDADIAADLNERRAALEAALDELLAVRDLLHETGSGRPAKPDADAA